MTNEKIREDLLVLADEEYRRFSMKLIPGTENILGVRLPALRKLAQTIAKNDWKSYLSAASDNSYEELMLQGLVIGYAKGAVAELTPYITAFVPKISNWGICDTFCCNLKVTEKNLAYVWEFLQPYFATKEEFAVRFGVVMLLAHYIKAEYISAVLLILDKTDHPGYYAKMAVAWAVSVCFIKFPEETYPFLTNNHLDDFTYNKALQKITESLRIDQEIKDRIRAMKRK